MYLNSLSQYHSPGMVLKMPNLSRYYIMIAKRWACIVSDAQQAQVHMDPEQHV